MPGRFALFTDENVDGPLIKALSARGWDVVRAVDVFGERTDDDVLFSYAAEHRRVFRHWGSASRGGGDPVAA